MILPTLWKLWCRLFGVRRSNNGRDPLPDPPVWTEDKLRGMLAIRPKKGCKKCHGTGRTGWRWDDKKKAKVKVACKCVLKQLPPRYSGEIRLVRDG